MVKIISEFQIPNAKYRTDGSQHQSCLLGDNDTGSGMCLSRLFATRDAPCRDADAMDEAGRKHRH